MRRAAALECCRCYSAACRFAHEGEPLEPHDLWTAWSFDPGVVIPLAVAAFLYLRGAVRREDHVRRSRPLLGGLDVLALALGLAAAPVGRSSVLRAHGAARDSDAGRRAAAGLSKPLVAFLWGLPFGSAPRLGAWSKARPFSGAGRR